MAEKLDPMVRLRLVLEGDQDPAHCPDAFANLIGVFLECYTRGCDPCTVLCKVALGYSGLGERRFFDQWSQGLVMPTPRMRQKVVGAIREEYARLQQKER